MFKKSVLVVLFLTFAFVSWAVQDKFINEYEGIVQYISDGDTLIVKEDTGRRHKIRIANIDAPELEQFNGYNSKNNIMYLTNQSVLVKVRYFDRYKREVADVYYKNQDIGLKQLQDGYAWVYTSFAKKNLEDARHENYIANEAAAKKAKKGLWRRSDSIPPWLYRKNKTITNE